MAGITANKISIIVPFYNVGDYIRKTVRSLDFQTYKNFEVFFINDGSTDNSRDILEEELKTVSFKYEVLNKKNGGVSSARNMGIDMAEGELIYFLDADDYLFQNTLEKVVEMFSRKKCDIVFFKYRRVDENGNATWHYNDIFKDASEVESGREIAKKYINIEVFIYNCSIVYKKDVLNGLYYSEHISMGEDQEFIIKALFNAEKVGFLNSELINYLKRKGSVTNSVFTMKMLEPIELFNNLYNDYKDKDEDFKKLLCKRRAREVLWRIKEYVRKGETSDVKEMKKYIKVNMLNERNLPYLNNESLRYLSGKNIIEIYFLKYFLGLSIRLVKIQLKLKRFLKAVSKKNTVLESR